jgi:hypothetical protein
MNQLQAPEKTIEKNIFIWRKVQILLKRDGKRSFFQMRCGKRKNNVILTFAFVTFR